MAYEIIEIDDTVISIRISDLLRLADQEAMQTQAKGLIG